MVLHYIPEREEMDACTPVHAVGRHGGSEMLSVTKLLSSENRDIAAVAGTGRQ